MATNKSVASAWGLSVRASASNMSTDGQKLWSYDLMIGYTDPTTGGKVLIDYTSKGGQFVSMTTSSKHIAPSRHYADFTVSPQAYEQYGVNAHKPPLMEEPTLDPHEPIKG